MRGVHILLGVRRRSRGRRRGRWRHRRYRRCVRRIRHRYLGRYRHSGGHRRYRRRCFWNRLLPRRRTSRDGEPHIRRGRRCASLDVRRDGRPAARRGRAVRRRRRRRRLGRSASGRLVRPTRLHPRGGLFARLRARLTPFRARHFPGATLSLAQGRADATADATKGSQPAFRAGTQTGVRAGTGARHRLRAHRERHHECLRLALTHERVPRRRSASIPNDAEKKTTLFVVVSPQRTSQGSSDERDALRGRLREHRIDTSCRYRERAGVEWRARGVIRTRWQGSFSLSERTSRFKVIWMPSCQLAVLRVSKSSLHFPNPNTVCPTRLTLFFQP